MKTPLAVMAFALAIGGCPATFAQVQGTSIEAARPALINFWRLDMVSQNTGLTQPTERVVTNPEDWQVLWSRVYENSPTPPPAPDIDFSKEVVVVVGIGGRSDMGYQLHIDTVRDLGPEVEVSSNTRVAGNRCPRPQSLSAPVEMVRMPKVNKPFTFMMRTWTQDCSR